MEKVKCSNCKGTGHVPADHGGKKYERCPICNGTGKKVKKKGGNTNGNH